MSIEQGVADTAGEMRTLSQYLLEKGKLSQYLLERGKLSQYLL